MRTDLAALEVVRPSHLKEALGLLADAANRGAPLVPLAGGTDVYVALNAGVSVGRRFLDLSGLRRLRRIDGGGDTLTLGAMTTYADCLRSKAVARVLPILADAARQVGSPQIQNLGTLGGNVENGSPAGDTLPVLAVAETAVVLASASGRREVPFESYYTGYRQTVRRPDELIVELSVRVPAGPQHFRKVGTRAAQAISKVVIAAIGNRIAFGSVAPTVIRARGVEAWLDAGFRDEGEARRLLDEEIAPIDDVRSTAAYRRRVAGNLLGQYLAIRERASR